MSVTDVTAKGADQRARVLDAAIQAIAEQGPERVTVRDIASRAGISPSHVLYYFGSRDQILVETLRWSEEELAERRRSELARFRAPARALRRFVEFYLPDGPQDLRWNLWHQVIARPPTSTETADLIGALEQGWVDDLAELVTEGQRQGAFATIDPQQFALRARLLMDGVAGDIALGLAGRTRAWGVSFVQTAVLEWLDVHSG